MLRLFSPCCNADRQLERHEKSDAVPHEGFSSVARQRNAVAFPAPLRPSRTCTSPGAIVSVRSRTASRDP